MVGSSDFLNSGNVNAQKDQRPTHGGNLIWAAQVAGCSRDRILDFSASINPWGPPDSAISAIQENLSSLNSYPDPNYTLLRQALASWHGLSADWILPGNGVAALLTWVGRELAQLDAVYVIAPAFADYARSLQAFDAPVVRYPLTVEGDKFTIDWAEFLEFAGKNNHSYGLLLNNPHNPTGKLFAKRDLQALLDNFSLVVVDEAFMDFLPPERQQSLLDLTPDYPNLVILRSLTKFYSLPGLRIGYAIAHPQRLRRWQIWRDPWSVNTLAAAAAMAVLQDKDFREKTWQWLPAAREKLYHKLSQIPGLTPVPSAVNYLLVQTEIPARQLQKQLLQTSQVLIRDCISFAELGDRYFRIAVRSASENQQLLAGLAQIIAKQASGETKTQKL